MPPANRHFVPGPIWHVTYRCHNFKVNRERVEAGSSRDIMPPSELIAVSSEGFVEKVKNEFAFRAKHCRVCILYAGRCRLTATIAIGKNEAARLCAPTPAGTSWPSA